MRRRDRLRIQIRCACSAALLATLAGCNEPKPLTAGVVSVAPGKPAAVSLAPVRASGDRVELCGELPAGHSVADDRRVVTPAGQRIRVRARLLRRGGESVDFPAPNLVNFSQVCFELYDERAGATYDRLVIWADGPITFARLTWRSRDSRHI